MDSIRTATCISMTLDTRNKLKGENNMAIRKRTYRKKEATAKGYVGIKGWMLFAVCCFIPSSIMYASTTAANPASCLLRHAYKHSPSPRMYLAVTSEHAIGGRGQAHTTRGRTLKKKRKRKQRRKWWSFIPHCLWHVCEHFWAFGVDKGIRTAHSPRL